jgi:hypothetical protein
VLEVLIQPAFKEFNENVEVLNGTVEDPIYMKYPQLLEFYARSRVLAIPMLVQQQLAGLTSLMDALGMGKPVIMTKHPLIDLDIEALGIGRLAKWVAARRYSKAGDRQSSFLKTTRMPSWEMGKTARRLVDQGVNISQTFGDRVDGLAIFE